MIMSYAYIVETIVENYSIADRDKFEDILLC